jgi:rhodanese-related sulfurtransferase
LLSRRSFLALSGAATLGVGAAIAYRVSFRRAEGAAVMTPPEASAAAETGEILLVDIRRPDEWRKTGVAKHAVRIDLRDAGFFDQLAAARSSDAQPIAVICARGVRSARMTRRLAEAGLGPVIDIPEGMLGSAAGPGWLARDLPITIVN